MTAEVTAAEPCITLALSADEFLALLSENVELAEGIFRMLIASRSLATGQTLIHGTLPADLKDAANLKAIDRALLLESSPLLARATATQIWRLSSIAREITIAQGAEAFAKGSEAAILIVLSGSLRVEGDGQADTAAAGDVIGMYETLAGSPITAKVTATTESNVLQINRGGVFELLADHTDLLQGAFSTLLRSTVASASAAKRSGSTISNTVSTP